MSYFTETFESILEFKGDIAVGYATARRIRYNTNEHDTGEKMNRLAKSAVKIGGDNKHGSGEHYKDIAMHDKNGKVTKASYDYYNSKQEKYAKKRDSHESDRVAHSIEKHNKKVNKESFDPVYEDLYRMGIID